MQLISMKPWLYVEILQSVDNQWILWDTHEEHIEVMNSFFCKEYGKEKVNYSTPTEKREVKAYNLWNRLAETSYKNIGAKLLLEPTNRYCNLK